MTGDRIGGLADVSQAIGARINQTINSDHDEDRRMADQPVREKLSSERPGFTRRFHLVYFEDDIQKELTFYLQPGMYDDGRLGEIFITGEHMGGFIRGAMDSLATMISIGLQYGVPLQEMTSKLRGCAFGPSGLTGDPEFRRCTSVFDLIAQYLDAKFPNGKYVGMPKSEDAAPAEQPAPLLAIAK